MNETFSSYLALLRSLGENLEQLTALARKKAAAANGDDLMALDEIMKQEQAMTLTFRGMEQTREKLLTQLGCGNVSLSRMPEHFPPERRCPFCSGSIRATARRQTRPGWCWSATCGRSTALSRDWAAPPPRRRGPATCRPRPWKPRPT